MNFQTIDVIKINHKLYQESNNARLLFILAHVICHTLSYLPFLSSNTAALISAVWLASSVASKLTYCDLFHLYLHLLLLLSSHKLMYQVQHPRYHSFQFQKHALSLFLHHPSSP